MQTCHKCNKEINGTKHLRQIPFDGYETSSAFHCEACARELSTEELAKEVTIEYLYSRFLETKGIAKGHSKLLPILLGKNCTEAFDFISFLLKFRNEKERG